MNEDNQVEQERDINPRPDETMQIESDLGEQPNSVEQVGQPIESDNQTPEAGAMAVERPVDSLAPTVSPEEEFPEELVITTDTPQAEEVAPDIADSPQALPDTVLAAKPKLSKKQIIWLSVIAVVALSVIGFVVVLLLNQQQPVAQTDTSNQTVSVKKLGITPTVIDGTVEYRSDNKTWQTLSLDSQLTEGVIVRTGAESRAVLALDDGSAVRLDANTELELTSLQADDVQITQLAGAVYSRVVASQRKYSVKVDQVDYRALGTAFVTLAKDAQQGVQVYQSSVKVGNDTLSVSEGKQYFTKHDNTDLKDKLTDIDIEALATDQFVAWNLSEDEKDTNFKDKMGVLAEVKQRAEEKARQAEQQAQAEAKALQEAAKAKAKAEAENKNTSSEKDKKDKKYNKTLVTRGKMSLWRNGNTFSWSYTGSAIYGYKLVYAKHPGVPAYGEVGEYKYYSDQDTTSAKLTGLEADKTYNVRVCAYTSGTETDKCVDYSNTIEFTVTK